MTSDLPPGWTQEKLDEAVAEAERGYDVDQIKARALRSPDSVHPTWEVALRYLCIYDPDGRAHILGEITDSVDYAECGREFDSDWNSGVPHLDGVCAHCVGEVLRRRLWSG